MQDGGTTGSEASSIAIVGMSGRFPGAPNVATFWQNIREGREAIRFFTDDELLAAGERPELLRDPAYVKACRQLADIDKFDAAFFGICPATPRSSTRSTASFSSAPGRRSRTRATSARRSRDRSPSSLRQAPANTSLQPPDQRRGAALGR